MSQSSQCFFPNQYQHSDKYINQYFQVTIVYIKYKLLQVVPFFSHDNAKTVEVSASYIDIYNFPQCSYEIWHSQTGVFRNQYQHSDQYRIHFFQVIVPDTINATYSLPGFNQIQQNLNL